MGGRAHNSEKRSPTSDGADMHFSIPDTQEFGPDNSGSSFTVSGWKLFDWKSHISLIHTFI